LLTFLILFVAALPVISKDATHWLRWLNTGDNYKLGRICLVPLVLIFPAPVLTKISFGLGPVKLEAATPGGTAKPTADEILEKMQPATAPLGGPQSTAGRMKEVKPAFRAIGPIRFTA
jgi:hypothetical protein